MFISISMAPGNMFSYRKPNQTTWLPLWFAVDIQGDRLLIGQPYASVAWIYKVKEGVFTQTQKLVAPDIHDFQQLGHSVALSADGANFILGAKADNEKGESAGAAYVLASATYKHHLLCA
jgi:hypothetical protein